MKKQIKGNYHMRHYCAECGGRLTVKTAPVVYVAPIEFPWPNTGENVVWIDQKTLKEVFQK